MNIGSNSVFCHDFFGGAAGIRDKQRQGSGKEMECAKRELEKRNFGECRMSILTYLAVETYASVGCQL